MFRRDPIFPHDALSPWETQVPASRQAWVARAFCVLVALFQRDELSLGKDVIWKCHAQEWQKCGIAVMVEADLTIRCESPSIVLTRLHGRPYGRPTGGTSGAGGLCVGLCPLPHKEDQCILSNNSSVRHLTAGTAPSSPSC